MDPMRYLKTTDGFERDLMLSIATRVVEIEDRRDHNRAIDIANQVGKMLSGKKG